MRNLKRALSLTLAMVMVLGLMVITGSAASADFDDAAEIEYVEAVDVLTGINVLEGDGNGSFNPKDVLTREMAAKIISYLLLGPANAEKLSASNQVFEDVATDRWSAGYIAYCSNVGIIAGYGNGNFGPEDELTGVAFAKMLLVALGYDATLEGYANDANWITNIAVDTIDAGISVDGVLLSDPLTREQAAQMVLKTLTANMVKYDSKGSNISIGDIVINNGASDAEVVTNTETDASKTYDGNVDKVTQFCEKYFPDLKKGSASNDDFGRPGYTWSYKNNEVAFAAKTPVATFTAKTTAANVAKALSGYKLLDTADKTYTINNTTKYSSAVGGNAFDTEAILSENGKDNLASLTVGNAGGTATVASTIADQTANGVLLEVYADNDKVVTAVVRVVYTTDEVSSVSTNKTTGDITYKFAGNATKSYIDYADDETNTDQIKAYAGIAKGDIVTYVDINGTAYVYPTTSIEGAQSSNKESNGVKTITVDGTVYTVGATPKAGTSFVNSAEVADYYFDQYGYVVHTNSKSSASTSYAKVVAVAAKLSTDFDDSTPSLQARVVLDDGTVGVYDVALEKDSGKYWIKNIGDKDNTIYAGSGTADTVKSAAEAQLVNSVLFGYTLDDSTITLEKLNALVTGDTAENTVYNVGLSGISKTKTSYTVNGDQSVLVNSATKFVAYNTEKKTATVYTGASSLPTSVPADQTGIAVLKTGTTNRVGTASVVYFEITSALTADATSNLVYVDGTYETKLIDGKDKYIYTGYKADGTTVDLTSTTADLAAGLYAPTTANEISGSPKTNADNALIIDSALLTVDGEMVKSGSNWYYITEDTQIVFVDDSLSDVNDNIGTLILVKDSSNVDVIYVTAD